MPTWPVSFPVRRADTIESLLDGLTTARIAIDMIEFSGIEFRQVDNRLMSMKLVQMEPDAAPMLGKMLGFVMRGYKVSRDLESTVEDFVESKGFALPTVPLNAIGSTVGGAINSASTGFGGLRGGSLRDALG